MVRAEQRERTRQRLVVAALTAFSERGFEGASTRAIAAAAGTTQGLLTYHFPTKDHLWRAAADRIFEDVRRELRPAGPTESANAEGRPPDPREQARAMVRRYVVHAATHPDLFRFMTDAGDETNDRRRWLVDTHLRRLYEGFLEALSSLGLGIDRELRPHFFYAMVGAGSLMFALGGEVAELVDLDVGDPATITRHADTVARLLVP